MDCSPAGSSVNGIIEARMLVWVAIPFSRGSSQPRNWTQVSCVAGRFFTFELQGRPKLDIIISKENNQLHENQGRLPCALVYSQCPGAPEILTEREDEHSLKHKMRYNFNMQFRSLQNASHFLGTAFKISRI